MNFFRNVYYLIKHLLSNQKMDWNNNLCSKKDCQIDEKTIISGNYQLNKVKIGLGTAIGKNANILNTDIGKFCSIGPNFLCGWGIHPTNGISINPAFYSTAKQNGFTYSEVDKIVEQKSIYIGNDVFIGANVTVLDGVTINDGAIIGAGAVVSKDIPPYAIAVGCPIQIIRYRFSQEIIVELLDIKWWDRNESVLKKVEKNFFDVTLFIKEIRANKGEL